MARRRRLLWKLYPTYLLVILLTVIGLGAFSIRSLRSFYLDQTAHRLEDTARLFGEDLLRQEPALDPPAVDALAKSYARVAATRITVILPGGQVLGDSESDPVQMENHADRPEVRSALQGEAGRGIRYSATLEQNMMYLAVPVLQDARPVAIVRTAVPLRPILEDLERISLHIALAAIALAFLVAGVAMAVSSRLTRPLNRMAKGAERFARGDLGHKLPVTDTEEIGRLADTLNRMAARLNLTIQSLMGQKNELEAVLAGMIEGVVAIDMEARILRMNEAAAGILSIDPAARVGRPLNEAVRNAEMERVVLGALEGDETIEKEFTLRQRGQQFIRVRATPLRDAGGQRIGALLVLNDVTRLQRLEDVRRSFVANVSHELKTPITSIHGFVETLRDGALHDPEKAERFLGIISRQSERLNAIIEDLLELSRIEREAETETIQRTETPLARVLEAAIADCQEKASARNVGVDLSVPGALSARVNPRMLEQAVFNLLDNAVKYSPPGSRVGVDAELTGETVTIRVRDQGPGIAAEHLPRIFERFYRVDKARSREAGGTGLGLAIVKHIAQAHGGSVSVNSTPGQGSLFAIHLPAA